MYQYYTAMPIEFYAACEGYLEKEKDFAKVIRFASFRVAESMAGSKAIGSIDNFWPIDEPKKVEPISKERVEAIFARHKIKRTNG
ncbi:hypothetical protein UFOVP217_27 [uncultured Caudovirales phage]|uniref:Uncharacterized protein n=1 Tax=uncultured Caudovirales phage TaxID=2100421 RepID=A0A6J7WKA8_9CAUD|nr:hypothetical protein UFOVP217_27 [uncultured Caudovirales phage]